jgi:hypothetical protein
MQRARKHRTGNRRRFVLGQFRVNGVSNMSTISFSASPLLLALCRLLSPGSAKAAI